MLSCATQAEFEQYTRCKWPAPDLLPRMASGYGVEPFECTNVDINHDLGSVVYGSARRMGVTREVTATEVRATFIDASRSVEIEAVTFDNGQHWDVTNVTRTEKASPTRPTRVDRRPDQKPRPEPLDPTAARQAIATAEEVFTDEEDCIRRG